MNPFTYSRKIAVLTVMSAWFLLDAAQTPGTWKNVTPHFIDSTIRAGASWGGMQYVLADPVRQSDLWASGDYMGTWKSTDYGLTWVHINTGANAAALDHGRQWSQAIDLNPNRDPATPPALYTTLGYGTISLWKSIDGGVNWANIWTNNIFNGATNISDDVGDDIARVQIVDPQDPNHLLTYLHSYWGTGGNDGLFETTNGGGTWIAHTAQTFSFQPHADMGWAFDAKTWIVLHGLTWPNNELYRTADGGSTWSVVANNLPLTPSNNPVQVGPTTYYMPGNPILKTTDAGATWTQVTAAGNSGAGAAMCLTKSNHLYITTATALNDANFKIRHAVVGNDAVWVDDPVPPADSLYWGPGNNASINSAFPNVLAPTFDGTHVVIVGSCFLSGIWRYVEPSGKPFLQLSSSSIEADYAVGSAKAAKTITLVAVNPIPSVSYSSPVTVSNKRSWLTVSVNSAKTDSQVITNTIDPSSLPDVEAKYYDTVAVHAPGADITDMTYQVLVWVRQSAVLTSIVVAPTAAKVAGGQSRQFSATALDQYGLNLAPQPTFAWATNGGAVSNTGLFTAGGCLGNFTVTASLSGISQNASATVVAPNCALMATVTASSQVASGPASAMIDSVISGYPIAASKEWSSNAEQAGAWAQLNWPTPVTIDSIALWDRPNANDQVLSGTLTFSDNSSILVGALPNDASAPWSQKFLAKTISWVKFTINSVSSTTANIGLAEFQVFNSAICSGTNTEYSATQNRASREMLSATAQGISVNCAGAKSWTLDLYTLNGIKMATFSGKTSTTISFDKYQQAHGFVVAKLRNGTSESVLKILSR